MAKEIEIIIDEQGNVSIEGFNLGPNERIEDVAKFLTNELATVTETGHKHTHLVAENTKERN